MNPPIVRLFAFFALLFALLVAFTSRWTVFDASSLRANAFNRRALLESEHIRRGWVRADDGTVLAVSRRTRGGIFTRSYPQGGLFAHAIGYSYTRYGQSGLERSRDSALTGQGNGVTSFLDQIAGRRPVGQNVVTTLDPRAQRVALEALGGRPGAVVALDPRTGAVKVLASLPGYDPNAVPRDLSRLERTTGSPILNRATQGRYPPGSTFKVVTAVAAIDSGRYTPGSIVDGSSPVPISGVPLANDYNQSFGPIDLTRALTFSVNTVWAQVAVNVGKRTMGEYMRRFGFYAKPPLDYPPDQIQPSGEFRGSRLLGPTSQYIDVGRMGIGQDKLAVAPLQMAMVASAIANGGRLMRPHLTARIIDADGRVVEEVRPVLERRVMSAATARAVTAMMQQVVREGTGTAAALQGIDVAGKTGTAQVGVPGQNITQPWFIAFAPVDHPRIAIAVTVERSQGGFGGTVAAPIAKRVMEVLLHD